jgi:hypothetical protein
LTDGRKIQECAVGFSTRAPEIWHKDGSNGEAFVDTSQLEALLAKKAEIEALLSKIDVWLLIFGIIVNTLFGVPCSTQPFYENTPNTVKPA